MRDRSLQLRDRAKHLIMIDDLYQFCCGVGITRLADAKNRHSLKVGIHCATDHVASANALHRDCNPRTAFHCAVVGSSYRG
jgi:hypothetical protein